MVFKMTEQTYRNIFQGMTDGLILCNLETGIVVAANIAASRLHGYRREEFIGQPVTAFIAPRDHIKFAKWFETVQPNHDFEGTISHTRLDGSTFTAEGHGTIIRDGQGLYLLYTIRDISEHLQSEQVLQQQIEDRNREQAVLLKISQTLASDLVLKPGLILDQLQIIIPYQHAVLFSLEELELVALTVRGLSLETPFYLKLTDTVTFETVLNRSYPQRIGDVWGDETVAQFLHKFLQEKSEILLAGIQSWMWIPLAVKGEIIGTIGVAHPEADAFTTHQANLALMMANQAAIAMVNTRLYGEAKTMAKVQERQRLAHNLHDAVNQSLFSAGLIAEVLPRLWEKNPAEGRKSLKDLRRLTRGALAEMRGLLAELQPQVLIDSELSDLLHQLATAFIGRSNLPIVVNVSGQSRLQTHGGTLPTEVQVAFYYLCQEALTNVTKHAKAQQIVINLLHTANTIEMHICDDGRGFDPADIPSGHYGLGMMYERAEAVEIELTINSQIGKGSDIGARWTVPSEEKFL